MTDSKEKLSPFLRQMQADLAAIPPEILEEMLHSPRAFPTRAQIAEEEAEIAKLAEDFHLNISSPTTNGLDISVDANGHYLPTMRRLPLAERLARMTPEECAIYREKFPELAKEHALYLEKLSPKADESPKR